MSLYVRWVWTNVWSIVTALVLHSAVGQLVGIEAASVVIGAPIIGGIMGWAQSRTLARRFPTLKNAHWITLTIVGAALVLVVGAVTSRLGLSVHFDSFEGDDLLATARRTWSAVFFTQLTGFLIGILLGGPQSRALPAPPKLRLAWMVASGAGWSLGMLLTALTMGFVDPEAELRWMFAALFAGLALTGGAVGVFTGLVLKRIAPPQARTPNHPEPLPLP